MEVFSRLGKMDGFEVRSSRLILLLMAPGLYIYSLIIGYMNPGRIEVAYAREVLSVCFLLVSLIPFNYKEWSKQHYGHVVFVSMLVFAHYLIYTMSLNDFGLDYLLGTYIVLFGGILLLTGRIYIILFTLSSFAHIFYRFRLGDFSLAIEGPILLSLGTIFLFSFFIQNGFLRYKYELKKENFGLETKVKLRTLDLEHRAKELAHKNRDLEEFAYVVSHDMKRPLRNVHSLASWVKDDLATGNVENAQTNLLFLMEQVGQMDLLVDGILKYSLGIEKKIVTELLNLNELVDTLVHANNAGHIHIEKDSSLPRLLVDKAQILQVFQNLVQNAIKYNDKPMVFINVGVVDEVDRFKFYVRDNGMGIAPDHYERIFKLFQKLNVEVDHDSSGIGLAVVKKIVGKIGGEIWVESEVGDGSTFYFTLYKKDVINGFGVCKNQVQSLVYH